MSIFHTVCHHCQASRYITKHTIDSLLYCSQLYCPFVQAEAGRRLVVADYGQLELRLLAHMTNCTSMLDAFRKGGCFHSRTAVGMFDHVRAAVDCGDVLLEWDYSKGAPPKPLVKDVYGAERRKAKTLNFSIAYGKTAHGLSKDWDVSVNEAKELLKAWYADRPEVEKWQVSSNCILSLTPISCIVFTLCQ
jgi:DNA polymerase family A